MATIIYEDRLAWVGMVLVDPEFRGKGIATALLDKAVAHLDVKDVTCVKLDATPQGKPVYERLGFKVEYDVGRWVLRRSGVGKFGPASWVEEDPRSVFAMDHDVFGADRSAVLRSVATAAPEFVALVRQGGDLDGYALGRKGSLADHLGPWIACNARAARELLESFLERSRAKLISVDILTGNPWARVLAHEKGFVFSRPLTRMYRGENRYAGRPDWVCAILGPEFG